MYMVIVPADGSRLFGDDEADIVALVPCERLALLMAQGFIGPEGNVLGT